MTSQANVRVEMDFSGLDVRFSEAALRAKQAAFASRVALDMREHVPFRSGTLQSSEPPNSNYEEGEVIWNTPYAQRVYNAASVRTELKPTATPQWAEVTKGEKMDDWRRFAAALLDEGATS